MSIDNTWGSRINFLLPIFFVTILGWVSIAAASVLAIIGRSNFQRLISWALGFSNQMARMGGVLAIIFGVFLIHALI